MESRTLYDGAFTATSRRRTEALDGAREVASRECVADERSDGLEPRLPVGGEIVDAQGDVVKAWPATEGARRAEKLAAGIKAPVLDLEPRVTGPDH